LRIQQNGLFKKNGNAFVPKVVRVGILDRETHSLVKKCSLEEIVALEMNKNKQGTMVK